MGTSKVKKKLFPKPYRSMLEYELHTGPMKGSKYEDSEATVAYKVPAIYKPDFVYASTPNILYEAKGRFRTFQEAKKYIMVQQCNPDKEIRFIIMNPDIKAYPQTKMRMGDWLTKHGFKWCTNTNIPKEWIKKK